MRKVSSTLCRALTRLTLGVLLSGVIVGGLLVRLSLYHLDERLRSDVLRRSELAAQAIPLGLLQSLSGTEADLERPEYAVLKTQLAAICALDPANRFVYIMGRRADRTVFFYADSEPAGSPDESPPGQVYSEVAAGESHVFDTISPAVVGPLTNRWGTWVSALVPITSPRTGRLVAVLGIDIDAREWRVLLLKAGFVPALLSALGVGIVLIWGVLARMRSVQAPDRRRFRCLEGVSVALLGLLVTAWTVWAMRTGERRRREDGFQRMAQTETVRILEYLRRLERTELEALARFFSASREVEADEFREFASVLDANVAVSSWELVSLVTGSEREAFETAVREGPGPKDFRIWERDPAGRPVPAAERDTYYPVLCVETDTGVQGAIAGFDLGSEPLRLVALERSVAEKRAVAVSTVSALRREGRASDLVVSRPVYSGDGSGRPRGFAVAVLDLDAMLDAILATRSGRAAADIELEFLESRSPLGGGLVTVARSPRGSDQDPSTARDPGGSRLIRPICVFDSFFAVAARARNPELAELGLSAALWAVLVSGVLLSLVAGTLTGLVVRQRAILERQVSERTVALRESRQRLAATLFSIGDGVISVNASGTVADMNPVAEHLCGWSADEARGRAFGEVFRIVDRVTRTPASDPVAQVLTGGQAVSLDPDTVLLGRGGGEHLIADSAAPIRAEDGALTGVVLVFRDVTEEGRVQRELAATKERLELAMDAADHGFWDWDLSTDSVYYSPRYCTMLGYEPDELPMRKETWLDLLHPEDREPALNTVTQAVSDGKAYDTEFRLRAKDRSWLWIRSRGKVYVADSQGRPQRVVGTHVDVTDRREAELSVLASREQYMLAVNGSRDGIWDWDLRTDSLFLSTRWKEMIGYADHELDNCMGTFTERIHPDDRDRVMGQVERYLKGELEVYRLEFRFRHRDGSYRWILARGEALRDGDGVAYRMAGSHSDITEDRRLQEELARALEEAKQLNDYLEEQTARANSLAAEAEMANVAKSRFLASMSHEIRTPMNGVIGMADLLLDTELSSEQRGFVEVLRTSGESLLGLLNDILDFSKIEAGHLSLEQIGFDLEDVVSAMAGAVAVGIHEKGLEFVCALRPGLPQRLIGDPARLRQILLNLVGNALKFTQSGEIVVTVEPEPASGSTDTETVLRFSVRDTGIGIPVAKQSLLFHRFSQVDPSVSRTYGGTGLGLAICRELAELMGGEIGVESVEGQGSTFWFTARFGLDSGIGASATEDVPGLQALPGLQVLVVDDSESAAAVLVEQLQAWGASPAAVRDGTSALRSLRRAALSGDPWEVLIVDRSMPAMDGWSLIDTVRGTTEYGAPEIVLMTSLGSSSGGNGPGSGGAGIRTLTKPVLPHDLQDSLRSLLTPVSRAMVEARAAEQPATVTDARPWSEQTRILLVEDNLPSQKVAMAILRKLGVQVEVAGNGVEALEALRRQPFDLVFMDMEMPEMGGLEATKRIRDSESGVRNPRIPVVAMTAHAMDGFRDKCMEAGMSDYVAKPVRTPELVRVLEQWLPGADDAGPPAAPDRDVEDVGAGLATVFDADELVERMVDDLDLARDVALGFLEDTPLQFERLEQALAEGDMATVRLVAHGIKGAAANVGAAALREAAATVEHAAASPDPEAAAAGFAVMVECFPVLCEALRGFAEGVA